MSEIRFIKIEPLPKPDKRPSRLSALLLWVIAAAGLAVFSFGGSLMAPVLQGLNSQLQLLVSNLMYYLPCVALPVFLLARRTPKLYEAYRPNPISLFDVCSIAVLAVLGVFFVNDIVVLWAIPFQELGFNVFTATLPAASTTGELMLSIITVAAIPAICEEFLFRGVILSAFEGEGTKRAMWISSLMFMMIHGSLLGAPTQMILGMLLASLVIWTNSIYAGLIYHTVHNAAALILEFMQSRTAVPDAAASEARSLLESIGGAAGILSVLLSLLATGAMIFISLKMFRLRGQLKGITMEQPAKVKLRRAEWALLIAGIALCMLLYFIDTALMLGGQAI